jgi:outer membrane receptor protein involved in Fe transport
MNRHLRCGRGLLLGASTIALAFMSTSAWAQSTAKPVQVDIPAQALGAQLQELGRETNTDILFAPDAVAHLRGPAVHGAMSARQAVERLIANTPLQVTLGADGALIVRAGAGVQATPAAALYRTQPSDPPAEAAAAPSAPAQAAEAPPNATVDEVVVVGSANPQGQRKLATGYAITTVNEQAIHDVAPSSAADLLKVVPGIFVETTSGVSGPNIEVRGFPTAGDSPFVTMQLDSLPIFPTPSLSFLDNSTQFRLDDTIKRVEATIGGPAVLLGNGQPGATINFVQKNGKDDPGGSLRFTTGTGDLYRVDGYYGAKLADGWYASVGGFYRTDNGVRDTQFPADQGYQFVGTLTHDIEDGKMQLYARVTHDQNAFFSPIPLNSSGSGSSVSISPFPGFNPLTATFLGNATRYVTFDTTPGLNGAAPGSTTVDLSKGRGTDNHIVGFDFDKSFDGWDFSNKLSYIDEDAPTIAQFTGDTPTTLGAFIQSEVAAANANPAAVAAAGRVATTGTATYVGTGQAATNLNQQVIQIGVWDVDKHLNAFQDEARLSHEIFDGNTLTLGMYFADYHSHDRWYLGNNQLMSVQNNAEPIAVTLDNGVQATSPDGIVSPVSFALNNSYDGKNVAGIISDSWRVTSKLRVDAGVRYEWETVDATIGNIATENLSSNPLAIYDNGASVLTGTSSPLSYGGSASAISIDANYEFTRNLNGFVGYNHGYALPTFDDLRQGVRQTTYVDQVQGGLKTYGRFYAADVTAFYSKFQGQPTSQILTNGTTVTFITDSQTEGVEFDGDVRPFQPTEIDLLKPLDLAISGDYQHGSYTSGGPGIQDNEVARQPDIQFRFTPSYTAVTPVGPLKVYGVLTYVAQRWADLQSTQSLPEYATLDVGASLDLPHGIQLQFTGTNVTNTLAITEGNVRVLGSGVAAGGVFLGRPLFGADYQFSAVIKF